MTFNYQLSERYCDLAAQILATGSLVYLTGGLLKSCFVTEHPYELENKYNKRAMCGGLGGLVFMGLSNCLYLAGKIASHVPDQVITA